MTILGIKAKLLGATACILLGTVATAQDGFSIAINGDAVAGDPRPTSDVRRTDRALQQADVQVSFDGLDGTRRLALDVVGSQANFRAGDTITLQSEMNYPSFVTRGEVRFLDLDQGLTLVTVPIDTNGQTSVTVPKGDNIAMTYRVYDAAGRFDETALVPLAATTRRSNVEEGNSNLSRQRIPVSGGAVTVTGQNVSPGATITALGERVAADTSGGFVLQRILPVGTHGVDVRVQGAGQNVALERELTVPASQWFYVATVDLTYGARRTGDGDWQQFDSGRLAFFAQGRQANGVKITASANSQEGEIGDIFRRFDDRDPRDLFLRIDPADLYPTYGDDSAAEDRTPTSGNLFLRAERDGNFVQWGDFAADLNSDGYLRNERTLYGLSGFWASRDQTSNGDAVAEVYAYAAQPDQLPQRDVLRGTGGSVYFLERQDIARATETLSIQTRDASTGRVLSSRQLAPGTDYQINYFQGVVTLARPLQSSADSGLVVAAEGEGTNVVLVAQYEYTPQFGDVDGYSYGARLSGWITDQIGVGVSGMVDQTGLSDQTLLGVDLTARLTEQTFVRLEYAQSEGPGFGSTFSADGGLIFDSGPLAAGTGDALKVEAQAALSDIGIAANGQISLYFEDRSEGFSNLDTQVTSATGDETFWGVAADFALNDTTQLRLRYDDYDTQVGSFERTASIEVDTAINDKLSVSAGVESRDVLDSTDDGSRTDVAVRLRYALSDQTNVYGFAQKSLSHTGLDANDRVGLGGNVDFDNGWSLAAELSDGTDGVGAQLLASYADGLGNSRYAGYALDPSRTLSGVDLNGRDAGQFVVGARERVNDRVTAFGENTYDAFGNYQSLTSAYGLTFEPNSAFSTTVAFEIGRIRDAQDNDFDRNAVSVGTQYTTETIEAATRIEYRTEDGLRSGDSIQSGTLLLTTDLAYKIDEDQRLIFSADLAQTQTDESAILDGDYADLSFGYAYRPAEAGRLNLLARYRYLMDEFGQRLDGTDEQGPLQRSHVASVDLSYNASQNWTLGGKLGYRMSETAASEGDDFTQNDAWLAAASARYHLVNQWDALIELRSFNLVQAETSDLGVLVAGYRQMNQNVSLGVGYNFGQFSDDLTDLVQDDEGIFVNLVANF